MSSFSRPLHSHPVFSYCSCPGRYNSIVRAFRRLFKTPMSRTHPSPPFLKPCLHCTSWEGVTVQRLRSFHRCEGWSLISDQNCGVFYLRVFFLFFFSSLFTLEGSSDCGSSGSEPPFTHPEDFLPARRAGGKSSPDVTSNKGKATGIEGGIRPIFNLTLRDPASSWHLSIFLLLCSRWGISCNFPSQGPFLLLRLNSCLLPKKKKETGKVSAKLENYPRM